MEPRRCCGEQFTATPLSTGLPYGGFFMSKEGTVCCGRMDAQDAYMDVGGRQRREQVVEQRLNCLS